MACSQTSANQILALPIPLSLSRFPEFEKTLKSLKADLPTTPLSTMGHRTDQFIKALLKGLPRLETVFSVIAHFNDHVTRYCIQQTEAEMVRRGMGPAPRPYCWISMGSDARGEQVIRTDQDNALIYGDAPSGPANEDTYFKVLAQGVTRKLAAFGFELCKGDVMATNPLWRRSQGKWHMALEQWVGSSDPKDVRKLTILLDFRGVYGSSLLAQALHQKVFELFKKNIGVSHYMVRDDNLFAAPKNILGRIRTHTLPTGDHGFNIKTSGLAHLVNGIRILAINKNISVPSTLDRLTALKIKKNLDREEFYRYRKSFLFLTRLKIDNHLAQNPEIPPHHIVISTLSSKTRKELDEALDTVAALQKQIHRTYNIPWMNFFN